MTKRASAVPLEHTEQAAFFDFLKLQFKDLIAFAIPNGGKRTKRQAVKLKREGVTAGIPDLMIARRCGPYAGMFIEMKRQKGGSVSGEQRDMIARLRDEGYFCVVARGWEEAVEKLRYYLSFGPATL